MSCKEQSFSSGSRLAYSVLNNEIGGVREFEISIIYVDLKSIF